jgi:hypothetical protein
MKGCEKCAAENPDDAGFCSVCGHNLAHIDEGQAGIVRIIPPPGASERSSQEALADKSVAYGPHPVVVSINNNGKAIASLVLGIFGIASCPILGSIIALILGYQARREIAASSGWQTGDQLAKAGVILGWIGIAIYVVLFIVFVIILVNDPHSW